MIDVHGHLPIGAVGLKPAEVAQWGREVGLEHFGLCATGPGEWAEVARWARESEGWIWPFFGVHPWEVEGVEAGWLSQLEAWLEAFPQAGVGEIGLHRVRDAAARGWQRECFAQQLELAARLRRPVALHGVGEWGAMRDLFQQVDLPPRGLLHRYQGSGEMARELLRCWEGRGALWFSFPLYRRRGEERGAWEPVAAQLPVECVLGESDEALGGEGDAASGGRAGWRAWLEAGRALEEKWEWRGEERWAAAELSRRARWFWWGESRAEGGQGGGGGEMCDP